MSGGLLKELEDDIHREEWLVFWRSHGFTIAAVLILTLVLVGGYLWWCAHEQSTLERESTRYEEALVAFRNHGPTLDVQEEFQKLSQKSQKGYRFLAQLQLFRLYATRALTSSSYRKKAQDLAERFLNDARSEHNIALEGFMALNLAYLRLNVREKIDGLLQAYNMPQNPWKGLALEAGALQAVQENNRTEAGKRYAHLLTTDYVNQSTRVRGEMEAIGYGLALPRKEEF